MPTLTDHIGMLKGIGEKRTEQLEKLGIGSIGDLLCYMPRTYRDLTTLATVAEMRVGEEWFGILTIQEDGKARYIKRNFNVVRVRAADDTGSIFLTWYNQPYMAQNIKAGQQFYVYGRPEYTRGEVRITSPMLETLREGEGKRLLPVYRSTKGLTQRVLRNTIKEAFVAAGDALRIEAPTEFQQSYNLLPMEQAYYQAHFPLDFPQRDGGIATIAFYEILLLKLFLNRAVPKAEGKALPLKIGQAGRQRFLDTLPFLLTGAQERVMARMENAMAEGIPMGALLQGDVGSGKTIVVFYALYLAALSGAQGTLLAPTEILCQQHYQNAVALFHPLGIRVEMLKSGMKKRERQDVLSRLASGEIDILIGTHAILEADVVFRHLAVAVTDEQHRFGVRQRALLQQKGEGVHTLVMSATPIPRSLALILYGDLELMVLDELPAGRKPVRTHVVPEHKEKGMLGFLAEEIEKGGQVYYVCPVIDETDTGLTSVQAAAEKLKNALPQARIQTLHGRMKQGEKDAAMAGFAAGAVDILVSTTVIEVGIDVKNATIMVIDNADRFGLAQLHQLRGRVGRGEKESYCFLLGADNERLRAFCEINDGFEIARMDLQNRGPGALMGQWQHGKSDLFFLNYATDSAMLERVLSAYEKTIEEKQYGEDFYYRLLALSKEKYGDRMEDIALN
ncbi:ATP-dependent DNA helicase RecG [Eubacteriales bacterium OttesenSCG-928-M02]|nr:ATP-dependent DNA helicase RecG [Eubacteriales bacterium OttesenSCG-928-M02]